ncbi:MAG: hypothetical protein AAGM38_13975 [Pseudomonadota bacterium]
MAERRLDRRRYYRDYYDYKDYKDNDNNDLAIGVLGAVVGLGIGAAIANSGPNEYRGDSYNSAPAPSNGACDYWANQCAGNWGVNNDNFYGCLRYHGCQ